ncbi:STAS domain-containing protein [Gammaproteobacteria bacterium]
MPMQFRKNLAVLDDFCTVEEAEGLLQWLQNHAKAKVNLKDCKHLHTSVLQVLMAARAPVTSWPDDPDLARWLKAVLRDIHS